MGRKRSRRNRKHTDKYIPTWHKDAIAQQVQHIIIVYDRAEGLIFKPADLEQPFRIGGTDCGGYPMDAMATLYEYEHNFPKSHQRMAAWFIPFVEKVANLEDFSLNDLQVEQRSLKMFRSDDL